MTMASPDSSTHLSASGRTIPIIVVPGIMGSRLSNPGDGELVWNPKGGGVIGRSPGNLVPSLTNSQWERLNDQTPLDPVESTEPGGYPADRAAKAKSIKHFYNLIPDYYDDLCFALKDDLAVKLKARGVVPRVYGAGYDWRQDNGVSATTHLARVVAEAREECNQEKVILVAHSQGGLVSRYFCKNGNESQVLAVFLIGSPSLGAVQPYVRLKRGIVWDDGGVFLFLRTELHLGAEGSRDLLRRFASMYQLMPNAIYCRIVPYWLDVDEAETGRSPTVSLPTYGEDTCEQPPKARPTFKDARLGYDTYRDLYAGLLESAATRDLYAGHIDTAERFHAFLMSGMGAYMHPKTFCICTTDLSTPGTAHVPPYGKYVAKGEVNEYVADGSVDISINPDRGDGSVNSFSCNPSSVVQPAFAAQPDDNGGHTGIEHGALPNHPDVIRLVMDHIDSLFPASPPAEYAP